MGLWFLCWGGVERDWGFLEDTRPFLEGGANEVVYEGGSQGFPCIFFSFSFFACGGGILFDE